ncbi:Bifunctional inhibitor/lipid-transfer protein/seed storage 2S albumin superfamily protein [Euphorbia peplus]|nr:Bifunctional inhibitor/lipid-transfer protein/seed storage 2S albumin superfamily protein [Euphorbia peplus]
MFPIIALALIFLIPPSESQISTPCTPSLLSSFTPCINFITNSTANATSTPTSGCCGSLQNLTSNGRDCLCLVVTGAVPFQLPINRTLAISLPRACNMPGVPLQCKASVAPVPAPGPALLVPTSSPGVSPSASPQASVVPEPTASTLPPESSTTPDLTPPSTTNNGAPTSGGGIRPVLTPPSSDAPSYRLSPTLMFFASGIFVLLKFY